MKSLSIRFTYNRNKRFDANGKAPLQIQIHLNNQTRYLSVGSLHPNQWDSKNKKIKIVGGKGKITNMEKTELEALREKISILEGLAFSFYNERTRLAENCTAKEIKDYLKGEKPVDNFTDFLKQEIFENPKLKYNTKEKAKVFFNNFEKFRQYRKTEIITFQEINKSFVREFDKFLQQKRKLDGSFLSQSYINQTLLDLSKYCRLADDKIKGNPFKNWSFKSVVKNHVHLTLSEYQRLEKVKYPIGKSKAKLSKELVLFSCWTGLRISDLIDRKIDTGEKECYALKVKHIIKKEEGLYLKKIPKKTRSKQVHVELPLFELFGGQPQRFIEKRIKGKSKEDFIFGTIQNKTLNDWIRFFMKEIGVDKEITFHSFRHTFAELMHNDFGIPLEDLRLLMGHKELKSTMIYAKTKHDRAIRAVSKIDWSKLNKK